MVVLVNLNSSYNLLYKSLFQWLRLEICYNTYTFCRYIKTQNKCQADDIYPRRFNSYRSYLELFEWDWISRMNSNGTHVWNDTTIYWTRYNVYRMPENVTYIMLRFWRTNILFWKKNLMTFYLTWNIIT